MTDQNIEAVPRSKLLGTPPLPVPWPRNLLGNIQRKLRTDDCKVVVLDDDPTGTQTVHGVPVLTHWSSDALATELKSGGNVFYLLTNTRSMPSEGACRLNRDIGANLSRAAIQAKISVETISRSDSTLRGHFPEEVDALTGAMQTDALPCLIIPCFFEGGRYTVNDIHYVTEGDALVPASDTAYAADPVFGYRHSNLRKWVEEKSGGRIPEEAVTSISIEDLRSGGPNRVAAILSGLKAGAWCTVNAADYRDLEVLVLGLLQSREKGRRFMYRTAASFVRVRCGIPFRELLQARDLVTTRQHGGVFVVGSHIPKTTAQVAALTADETLSAFEIDVERLLDDESRAREIAKATERMNRCIGGGRDVLLYTSRQLIKGSDAGSTLRISRRVSDSLIEIVKGMVYSPRYLVAKGGITASDVATKGLGVRRAMVLGQILPGVPVWSLGPETRFPGLAYIVFPGNVGDDKALATIRNRLRASDPENPMDNVFPR